MKDQIKLLIKKAISALSAEGELTAENNNPIQITRCNNPQHGDFASNIALLLAKATKQPPRNLAEKIVAHLPKSDSIAKVDIAGPGFINFTMSQQACWQTLDDILQQQGNYGQNKLGNQQRIQLEFVSANPTGPLHVGHGRSAAFGACVARLLSAVGYQVHAEYYVNDAGRQMRILALSTWLRYLQQLGENIALPKNAYQGDYIEQIAQQLIASEGDRFHTAFAEFKKQLPDAPNDNDDKKIKEQYLDQLVENATTILGIDAFQHIQSVTLEAILTDIQQDLSEFGVNFDAWFRESKLVKKGLIDQGVELLASHGHVFKQDGATWFRATTFGDEKDRVLIRENGQPTYFASDVAYHLYKYQQGYDQIIDIFGADHHGYIKRIRAFLQGLEQDPNKLTILLVQFAILYRGKEKVQMSTRSGQFVTLRQLRKEVGNDAARFFYIMRKPEQHLDFDLELAKSQTNENPVYYIQYAHARICSVWQQLQQKQWQWDKQQGIKQSQLLNEPHEMTLLKTLAQYPETIETAAAQYAPHVLAHYLQQLATHFHTYYNASQFLVDQTPLRNARLALIAAVKQVLANGLDLLGLSAPQQM